MRIFKRGFHYVYGKRSKHWRASRTFVQALVVTLLIAMGWLAGRTQSTFIQTDNITDRDKVVQDMRSQTPRHRTSQESTPTLTSGYGIAAGGGLTYVGDAELNVYFQKLKDLGITWVRWDLDWGQIQSNNASSYNWEVADRVVAASKRFNISSLVIIDYTPAWARKASCASEEACAPANPAVFAAFAGKAAMRYKDQGVKHWEIWNEQNYNETWLPRPSVKEYVDLLKPTYAAIKQADSAATVMTGGLAAVADEDNHIAPITFVKQLYDLGAKDYFDAVAIHPYSYPAAPSHVAWWNRWQQIVPIHDHMTKMGDGGKRVWITEFGAPTGGPGASHAVPGPGAYTYGRDYMSETAQSQILTDAVNQYRQYSPWAGPFFWYTLEDRKQKTGSPEDFFGLIRSDGTAKPAYETLKKAIQQPVQ